MSISPSDIVIKSIPLHYFYDRLRGKIYFFGFLRILEYFFPSFFAPQEKNDSLTKAKWILRDHGKKFPMTLQIFKILFQHINMRERNMTISGKNRLPEDLR